MPPPSFLTRAKRIFQNSDQSQQSDPPQPNPNDSANQSQYETDGSSYEMLVVESPSKPPHVPPPQSAPDEDQQTSQSEGSTPQIPEQSDPNLEQPANHPPSPQRQVPQPEEQPQHQSEPRTPSPPPRDPSPEPRTPPPETPAEPQTPSRKLPIALRRITATPAKLPETPGYNLRSRTRSQAPPTPQPRPTPSRSRRRELRRAPSAHTTSGIAARPRIVSRREIDECSYISLRALCRNFGLPTAGTKAELRERAIERFEKSPVLDEQTQPLDNEEKQEMDVRDKSNSVRRTGDSAGAERRNEENSGQVRNESQPAGRQEERSGERSKEQSGMQITTSTVKPAGQTDQIPVDINAKTKSDEPSVHAKSDAPEKDPSRKPPTLVNCSIANSPNPDAVQETRKIGRPTVSSTGNAAQYPESPKPPPFQVTPRLVDYPQSYAFPTQARPGGPTESVDARGDDINIANVFQELASGRRNLSSTEYEAVLRALREKAPIRKQPLQVPINAARVSLSALPSTPIDKLDPTSAPAPQALAGAMAAPTKAPVLADENDVHPADVAMNSSAIPSEGTEKQGAGEQFGDSKPIASFQNEKIAPSGFARMRKNREHAHHTRDSSRRESNRGSDSNNVKHVGETERLSTGPSALGRAAVEEMKLSPNPEHPETSTKPGEVEIPKPKSPQSRKGTQVPAAVLQSELNQNKLPALFEGARGGPHEGNISGMTDDPTKPQLADADQVMCDREENLGLDKREGASKSQNETEVTRSAFATPRDLIRRFNRLREDSPDEKETLFAKPRDKADPASSLQRRNARRSTSGLPLFYSSRGPSFTGRSIYKSKTSSKIRTGQNQLRLMNRSHNTSGRASFRVKRPLSASAGALLVDLRRNSGAQRPPVERVEQRGSYQAEMARRPPPMPASALRILGELQKIQDQNQAIANKKRPVSPPPLPPSVVKRARRAGHFTGTQIQPIQPFSVPSERQIPRIPLVAFGAGKKRASKSPTNGSPNAFKASVGAPLGQRKEDSKTNEGELRIPQGADVMRTEPERTESDPSSQKKRFGTSANKFARMPATGVHPNPFASQSSRQEAIKQPWRQTSKELEPSRNATATAKFPIPADTIPWRVSLSSKDLSNAEENRTVIKKAVEQEKPVLPQGTPQTKEVSPALRKSSQFLGSPIDDDAAKPGYLLGMTKSKASIQTVPDSRKPSQGIRNENQSSSDEDKAVLDDDNVANNDLPLVTSSAAKSSDSKAFPTQLQKQGNQFTFSAKPESTDDRIRVPEGSSEQSLPNKTLPSAFNSGFGGAPFVQTPAPFSFDAGKSNLDGDRNTEIKPSDGGSTPFQTLPFSGSFTGKRTAAEAVTTSLAPTNPSNGAGSESQIPVGTPSDLKPEEPKQSSLLQDTTGPSEEKESSANGGKGTSLFAPQLPVASSAGFAGFGQVLPIPNQLSASKPSEKPEVGSESRSNLFSAVPSTPSFGFTPSQKATGLATSNESAPQERNEKADVTKPHDQPAGSEAKFSLAPFAAPQPEEKVGIPDLGKTNNATPISDNVATPIGSGPFSAPGEQSDPKPAFSFPSASQPAAKPSSDPFGNTQFNSAFSSSDQSKMFVFGSSTDDAAGTKLAPSFSASDKPASQDQAKSDPFGLPPTATPFSVQPNSQMAGTSQNAGSIFKMSPSSEPKSSFGFPGSNPMSGSDSGFGSSPSLFNTGPASQPFGGSSDPKATPFGGSSVPSTLFNTPSNQNQAPIFGGSGTGTPAPSMFGASSSGASGPGFGVGAPPPVTFGNSNVNTFGTTNNPSNPFSQSGSFPTSSPSGMFGATAQGGAFNVGSATRAPQSQRRRVRVRRTIR